MANDPALAIMAAVLIILLWLAAWSLMRLAKDPTDERRVMSTWLTACALAYGGFVIAYLLIRHL